MSTQQLADHQSRSEYPDLLTALHDADRVASDLLNALAGQVVVPADRLEFLTRRLRGLVRACIDVEQGSHGRGGVTR